MCLFGFSQLGFAAEKDSFLDLHKTDFDLYVGPDACAKCHKLQARIWKETTHYKSERSVGRKNTARKIALAMGLRSMNDQGGLCLKCHFTQVEQRGRPRAIAGISCENCHGAGKNYNDRHADFSGNASAAQETPEQAAKRWQDSVAGGLIRPIDTYSLARNCFGCHTTPNEKLVNQGDHTPGSKFELASWLEFGNVWHGDGAKRIIPDERRRMLFVVGQMVELEISLRALAIATQLDIYSSFMSQRADRARQNLQKIAAKLQKPEFKAASAAVAALSLEYGNEAPLTAAAELVAREAKKVSQSYNGKEFAAIDGLIPEKASYEGAQTRH